MAGAPTPDLPKATPDKIVASTPIEKQSRSVSQKVEGLLKRFTPWVRAQNPDPDISLQIIANDPLQGAQEDTEVVETADGKTSLSQRLGQIRAGAHKRTEKISLLLKASRSEETEVAEEPIPLEVLSVQAEELSQADLAPSEYLIKSGRLMKAYEQARNRIMAEDAAAQSEYYYHQTAISDIDYKLQGYDRLSGVRRLTSVIDKGRLNQRRARLEQEAAELQTLIASKRESASQAYERKNTIRQKQEDIISSEATADIGAIKADYEAFLGELLQDGTITREIQDAYIRDVVSPQFDENKVPAEKRDAFYSALRNYLDHRSAPEAEKQVLRQELDKFAYEDGFYYVRDAYQPLLYGADSDVITRLVGKIAASDITGIKTAVESRMTSYESRYRFERAYERAVDPDGGGWRRNDGSFGEMLLSELNQRSGNYPHMRLWSVLTLSPTVNELFGNLIKAEDDRILATALVESLSDRVGGEDIDVLGYYPRAEAIRNLVILAAADYGNNRTARANSVLARFARRSNWNELLDQAEQVYPALKTARPFLEHWDYRANSNNPGVQEAVKDFAASVLEDEQADERLVGLAVQSLPTSALLERLHRKGVIPDLETVSSLKEAEAFLAKIENDRNEAYRNSRQTDIPYLNAQALKKAVRNNLFKLMYAWGTEAQQDLDSTRRLVVLSQKILDNSTSYPALEYLANGSVVERIKDTSFRTDNLSVFLAAYQTCPALLTNNNLLGEFCRQFAGEQSVTFFRDMSVAYQDQEQQLNQIISLVGKGVLSKARALELPTKAGGILSSPQFSAAIEFPQLFLETDDGVDFLTQANTASLFSLDRGLEVRIGERIRNLQRDDTLRFSELLVKIAPHEIEQIDRLLSSESPIEANQQNWQQLLMGYVRAQANIWSLPELSQVSTDRINTLFNDPKVRDLCLNGLKSSWFTYLKSGKPEEIPFSLNLMSEFINYCGGAGPLSQLDSLNSLISSVNLAFARKTTAERTKLEISQGIVVMEDRFTKERWSNEDRTDFYNISRDILGAAPSLFSDYLTLFEKLTPSQMRLFAKDIYPLYRTKLVLMEKKDEKGHRTFDKEQLLHIRKDIRGFADVFNAGEKPFEIQKQKLLEEIRGLFKDRFGVIKIPQEFTPEHMRSFTNVSTYLANLHGRTPDKETVLGFYLSLMINDRWDGFRRGEAVDPSEYLTPEKSSIISRLLEERQRLNPLVPESLGITQEDMPEFLKLLQQETQNMVVGNIETIDVKLTNIILNLQGLEDLDLYPEALDKQRMQLLLDWGNKRVGSVVARMYQSLATSGKSIQFSEEDTKIQQQITHAIQELGLSLTPQTLKEHFQDGIKPLATVVNLLNFVGDTRAEQEIEALRDLLKPSQKVIEVFRRLGEDFKPTSGAMALSQDLSYLDNLIVKREDELQPQEKALLTEYTTNVRTQMVKLEGLYSQIKNKFGGLKQGGNGSRNPLLRDKLDQIDRIVNAQTTQQAITSTTTNNLNVIIENIRECLSCTREGCNNDTDLTFGDMNKFYLYSQSETQQRGSISDQLVFVEPVIRADGSQEISFVLDRIYGTNTPTILENQVETVLKKYRTIKQRFPGIKLSIFISDAAILSVGASTDMLLEVFKAKNILAKQESVEVDVAPSAAGDHYVEFEGSSRTPGKRSVKGVILS